MNPKFFHIVKLRFNGLMLKADMLSVKPYNTLEEAKADVGLHKKPEDSCLVIGEFLMVDGKAQWRATYLV